MAASDPTDKKPIEPESNEAQDASVPEPVEAAANLAEDTKEAASDALPTRDEEAGREAPEKEPREAIAEENSDLPAASAEEKDDSNEAAAPQAEMPAVEENGQDEADAQESEARKPSEGSSTEAKAEDDDIELASDEKQAKEEEASETSAEEALLEKAGDVLNGKKDESGEEEPKAKTAEEQGSKNGSEQPEASAAKEKPKEEKASDKLKQQEPLPVASQGQESKKRGLVGSWARFARKPYVIAALVVLCSGLFMYAKKYHNTKLQEAHDHAVALSKTIKVAMEHSLRGVHYRSAYQLIALESQIKNVSEDSIHFILLASLTLKNDLYEEVDESEISRFLRYEQEAIDEALSYADRTLPENDLRQPERPWRSLARKIADAGSHHILRISVRMERHGEEREEGTWRVKQSYVRGESEAQVLPIGEPLENFGGRTYVVDTIRLAEAIRDYNEELDRFFSKFNTYKESDAGRYAALQERVKAQKEEVLSAFSEGALFQGIAFGDEPGQDPSDVFMVITETRGEGGMIKGVFKLNDGSDVSKHFTGSLDLSSSPEGEVEALMRVTTVAFDTAIGAGLQPSFFNPQSISRLRLYIDGNRVEGRGDGISMRLGLR